MEGDHDRNKQTNKYVFIKCDENSEKSGASWKSITDGVVKKSFPEKVTFKLRPERWRSGHSLALVTFHPLSLLLVTTPDDYLWGISFGESHSSWVGVVIKLGHVTKPGQAGFHSGLGILCGVMRGQKKTGVGRVFWGMGRAKRMPPEGWLHQTLWGKMKTLDFILNTKESCKALLSMGSIFLVATNVTKKKQSTEQSNPRNSVKIFELVISVLLWASSRTLGICKALLISLSPSVFIYKIWW